MPWNLRDAPSCLASALGWRPEALHAGDVLAAAPTAWFSPGNAAAALAAFRALYATLYASILAYEIATGGPDELMYLTRFKTLLLATFGFTAALAMLAERLNLLGTRGRRRISSRYAVHDGHIAMAIWVFQTSTLALVSFCTAFANAFGWELGYVDTSDPTDIALFVIGHGVDYLFLLADVAVTGTFVYMRHLPLALLPFYVHLTYYVASARQRTLAVFYTELNPSSASPTLIAAAYLAYPAIVAPLLYFHHLLTLPRFAARLGRRT